MKTLTLVALAGVALTADHSYFRNPTRTPMKADSPSLHKLDYNALIRRFEDEEFHFKKDFQRLDENAAQYEQRKRPDYKDDLDEDELEVLQTMKSLIRKLKLSRRGYLNGVDYDDDELGLLKFLKNGKIGDKIGDKIPITGNREYIKFDDEEFSLRPRFIGDRRSMLFGDDEGFSLGQLFKQIKSGEIKYPQGNVGFDDNEFRGMSKDHSRAGAFSSRNQNLIMLDDEADNSLFDLGGLVKDGLNIYKDVKSHNYGDLVHHGTDAVGHIKNKKHK